MEKQIIYKVIKLFLFFIIINSVFSCKYENKLLYRVYPNKYVGDSIVTFELDDFKNIRSLIDSLDNIFSPKLIFKDSLVIKSVFPKVLYKISCLTIPMLKEKNIIAIDEFQAIKHNKKYPLDSLQSLLKKDYLNINKDPYHCINPDRLGIIINTKKSNLIILKKQLSILTKAYDSLNIKYSLNIELQEFVKPPPPPALNYNN